MNLKRHFISVLLLVALAAGGLTACAAPQAAPTPTSAPTTAAPTAEPPTVEPATPTLASASAAFPLTVTDQAGVEVTIPAEPQRIVSLTPSFTEILFALSLGDRVVGVTTFCDYPEEAKTKEQVGSFTDIDLEKVVDLNPDLVLATSVHAQAVAPALRERGLTVLVYEATDIPSILAQIQTFGRITGRVDEAQAVVDGIQAQLDAVATKISQVSERPRVFWELDATLYTAGEDSFTDGLITLAGGDNVGRHLPGEWPQFNLEALIDADPEIIVLGDHGFGEAANTVKSRPGWGDLTAVKNDRIIEVDDINLVSRPGPRVGEAVEYLAKEFHPELFN